jgi:hypothetical protein
MVEIPVDKTFKQSDKKITSIQRLDSGNLIARDIAETYFKWLKSTWSVIVVKKGNDRIALKLKVLNLTMILLEYNSQLSMGDKAIYDVIGGFFVKEGNAQFIFTQANQEGFGKVELVNFESFLPWWLYRFTQGKFHSLIMLQYNKYLKSNH